MIGSTQKKRCKAGIMICAAVISVLFCSILIIAHLKQSGSVFSRQVTLDTSAGMTKQQRSDDFAGLCEHIENNVPFLYAYEKLYNISYDEIKAYYKNKIEEADSDFEYYSLIQGFLYNIPSGHMSAGFPLLSKIDEDFSVHLAKNESFVNAQNYWFEVIHNECRKHYDTEASQMIFAYYSGEYRGIAENIDNDIYGINKAALLTVNGVDIDEFIKVNSLTGKLRYDHINHKPFRDAVVFNDAYGEECVVEYINAQGEKCSVKMYYGADAYLTASYTDYFKELDGVSSENNAVEADYAEKTDCIIVGDLTVSRSEEKNLLFVRIDKFFSPESNAEVIENTIIDSSKGIDNIIIDLRSNVGGYYEYAKAVLGAVSDRDIKTDSEVYITEAYYNCIDNKNLYKFDEETGLYRTYFSESITGKAEEKKNVYLLISDVTGSAADNLAWEFKRNNLGTIIGTNNTGGERDGTICLNYNDISGIYYTYTAYAAMNPDGIFSSVEGTPPDIYVQQPVEAYFKRESIKRSGEDPYTPENRLKWDNVLIKTLELINQNDKGKAE